MRYYARVKKREIVKRIALLPDEPHHPRANDDYWKIMLRDVQMLPRPVKNIIPRRVSFGFTSLKNLLSARDILELYGVPKTEQIIAARLKRLGIHPVAEHTVSAEGKRYRVDLAIFCEDGKIAVECDNKKAHSGKMQAAKDKAKDAALRRLGWSVIRLAEKDIIERPDFCARRAEREAERLGYRIT